jgi:hypothetical protein
MITILMANVEYLLFSFDDFLFVCYVTGGSVISKFKIQKLQYLFLSNLLILVPLQLLLSVSYFHKHRVLLGEPKLCREKVLHNFFPSIIFFVRWPVQPEIPLVLYILNI